MSRPPPRVHYQTLHFRKLIRAPLPFVFRWCTDYRDDDDRLTNSIYHYRPKIVLRERARIVRIISVPGVDRNRNTDVEIISLQPPDRWHLEKLSVSDDESGDYLLKQKGPELTLLEMRFSKKWKGGKPSDPKRYRALFNRVWNRYVDVIEEEFTRRRS